MIINLLPNEEKIALRHLHRTRATLLAAELFAGVMIVATLGLTGPYLYLRYGFVRPVDDMKETVQGESLTTTNVDSITAQVRELNRKIDIINSVADSENPALHSVVIMRIVEAQARARESARSKITISSINIARLVPESTAGLPARYRLSLSGVAENRESLFALAKELGNTTGVITVDNPIANYVPGENSTFGMSVVIR